MITEKNKFGAGLPAEILGACYAEIGCSGIAEPCFRVNLAGGERFVPIGPSSHYIFLSESDIRAGKIPEVFD